MSESTLKPAFSDDDLCEVVTRYAQIISPGHARRVERTRPDDDGADILALIGHEGTAIFTVIRLPDRFAAYDECGQVLGESQNVADLLNLGVLS